MKCTRIGEKKVQLLVFWEWINLWIFIFNVVVFLISIMLLVIYLEHIFLFINLFRKKSYFYFRNYFVVRETAPFAIIRYNRTGIFFILYLKCPPKLFIIAVINFLFSPHLRNALNCTFRKYQLHYIRNIFPIHLHLIYLCTYINQPCHVTWNPTSNNDIDNFIIYLIMLN